MKAEITEQKTVSSPESITPNDIPEKKSKRPKPPLVIGVLFVVILIYFAVLLVPLMRIAETVGKKTGEGSGSAAGIAIGSVEGAVQGAPDGYAEGKEEGLSAKDTEAEIANTIEGSVKELGKLEVLAANVDLTTYHTLGKKYGALYLARGSAVFTVDLGEARVNSQNGSIYIELPKPEAEITIDPSETETIAEWQRKYFDGTSSEGFEAEINSFKEMSDVSEDEVANYSELQELASESAIKQVEEIAYAVRGNNDVTVKVSVQSN